MIERPGRVTLRLPDGHTMPGRLLERRQTPDGTWRYIVAVAVPADAVQPIDGETYSLVPTWRPWTLHTRWLARPGTLHRSDCTSVTNPAGIGVRGLTSSEARAYLAAEPDTILCPWCQPAP